jgi:anion-transporting  ArsA/GET3 family ATPase
MTLLDSLTTFFRGCKLPNGQWNTRPTETTVSVDVALLRRLEDETHAVMLEPPITNAELRATFQEAKTVFDQLTEASYMGTGFRMCLVENPQALAAARRLVDALKASGIALSTPDYKVELVEATE